MHLLISTILLTPKPYLDPGSGSILIQLLLAVILGAGVAIRVYWKKIKGLFQGKQQETLNFQDDFDKE